MGSAVNKELNISESDNLGEPNENIVKKCT
jgi:hypothetical protein